MKTKENNWQQEFVANACYRMDESLRMIARSFELLSEEDLWKRPNMASNSIGNLVLHLCGNITQYALSGLGGTADMRRRDEEFQASSGGSKKEMLQMLTTTISNAKEQIKSVGPATLLEVKNVQGFKFSGIGIVIHVVEHLSYHTGQIAFWTKLLKGTDLGFYREVDLNQKNS